MSKTATDNWDARNKRNTVRLGYWTGAWVLTLAVAVFGPVLAWENQVLTVSMIILNVIVGAGMIVANKHHLDGLDELQRRIQLEAMALALGVGLVGGLAYSTADITDVIAFDAEISFLVILISIAYMIGLFFGRRKYQ